MDDDIIIKQEDSGIYIYTYIHQAILYLSLLIY